MDLSTLKQLTAGVDLPAVLLLSITFFYFGLLIKWHSANGPFDFRASLFDPPSMGAVSLSRLGQLTALVTSTNLLVYYALLDKLTEWMFALYMAAWAGTYIANKWAPKPEVTK